MRCGCAAIFVAAAAWTFGTTVAAQTVEKIKVDRQSGDKSLSLSVAIHLPKSAGARLPAIIIVHGSDGVRAARELAYARRFNDLGVAAVVVDSFGPRGVGRTVNNQAAVRDIEMLGDAVAVLKAITRRPEIDPTSIGLIGFSKGGTVAIKAALRRYMKDGEAGFALLIALYPWCGELPMDFTPAGAPLLMLLGAEDTYVGTASCREYAQKFKAAGGKLALKTYDGARHGWDVPGAAAWTESRAQNSSKCVYEEVQPGRWIERRTRLTTFDNGAPTPDARKARAACTTIGASGGYDAAAAKRAWQDIAAAVRERFRLE